MKSTLCYKHDVWLISLMPASAYLLSLSAIFEIRINSNLQQEFKLGLRLFFFSFINGKNFCLLKMVCISFGVIAYIVAIYTYIYLQLPWHQTGNEGFSIR